MKKETARQKKIAEFVQLFVTVNREHRALVEKEVNPLGIHASQHNMLMIIESDKNICQKDIAKELGISSAAVAVTLNKLEGAELISRTQSFDDARMNHIGITEKGSALLKATREKFNTVDKAFFDGITDEEIETMSRILAKISENAKNREEAEASKAV